MRKEMPNPKAQKVEINGREQTILERIIRQATAGQWLVIRSRIVLGAGSGGPNTQLAKELGVTRGTIQHWRERWQRPRAEREQAEDEKALRQAIENSLADEERSGAPGTFSAEQIVQIVAVACEDPQVSGYPVSHWTPKEVAQEAIKRGIVETISQRQAGRFLKRG